jgi:hypothetical protein
MRNSGFRTPWYQKPFELHLWKCEHYYFYEVTPTAKFHPNESLGGRLAERQTGAQTGNDVINRSGVSDLLRIAHTNLGRVCNCLEVSGIFTVGHLQTGRGNECFEPLSVTWQIANHAILHVLYSKFHVALTYFSFTYRSADNETT